MFVLPQALYQLHYHTHTHTHTHKHTLAVNDVNIKKSKAYCHLLESLKVHPNDIGVQTGCLLALAHVLRTDTFAISSIMMQGQQMVILDSLRAHSENPLVVTNGCRALHVLSSCEERVKQLWEDGALQVAMAALEKFGEKESVVCAASALVDGLTAESEGEREAGRGQGKRGQGERE